MNKQQWMEWCASFAHSDHPFTPLVMGILNVTTNSFYDESRCSSADAAYDRAQAMIEAGADIIDIGGESSRPGAEPISVDEELDRVIPIIERLTRNTSIALSIDTYKPEVMQAALSAGVACINDIYALQMPNALEVVAQTDIPICLMHMQGQPQSMQDNPQYEDDVIHCIDDFFQRRLDACAAAGIARARIILDPGFGFGKKKQHNLQIVRRLSDFQRHGMPILLGVSRKSTLGDVLNQPPSGRLIGGIALNVYAMLKGAAIFRTHDVLETKQACRMIQSMFCS